MVDTDVTRTLDVDPAELWRCVRAFGDVPWIAGTPPEVRGEGVGQLRIFDRPGGRIHERLTSLDDATRTLTYMIPEGMPFPVTRYEATMVVTDDGGRGRLCWSCRFEPETGANGDEIARQLRQSYGMLMDRIEQHLKET